MTLLCLFILIDGPQISSVVIEMNRNRTEALVHWEPNSQCLYYVVFWITVSSITDYNFSMYCQWFHQCSNTGYSISMHCQWFVGNDQFNTMCYLKLLFEDHIVLLINYTTKCFQIDI